MGGAHYFVLRQGGGRIFVHRCILPWKSAHVYIINRIVHTTHPPSTSLIQISVCISQACVASHKWTSGVLTFQEKESKFHVMNFTAKPSHVEKLSRSCHSDFRYCTLCNYRLTLYHVAFENFPHEVNCGWALFGVNFIDLCRKLKQ